MTKQSLGKILITIGLIIFSFTLVSIPFIKLFLKIPNLLGFPSSKTYLVIYQNHREIRPTGGFMGSFAIVNADRGKFKISVDDIYSPDGRISGYVAPPEPIQEAFSLGTWRLRDANWDPDFPESAKTIAWFMLQADFPEFDAVVGVNSLAVEKIVSILKEIYLPDYRITVNSDNFWEITQSHSQDSFFSGSKQKPVFLSRLKNELIQKISRLPLPKKADIMFSVLKMLGEKQIEIFSQDKDIQSLVEGLNWAGEVKSPECPIWLTGCIPIRIMLVEANLGSNKSNCCVDRSLKIKLEDTVGSLTGSLNAEFSNQRTVLNEKWGGAYKAWVRMLINDQVTAQWLYLKMDEKKSLGFEFALPYKTKRPPPIYLMLQKQSGIENLPVEIILSRPNGKTRTVKSILRTDRSFLL